MVSLLKLVRQPTEKKTQEEEASRERDQEIFELLENATCDKKLMLEIRCDSTTVVDWVDVAAAQNFM